MWTPLGLLADCAAAAAPRPASAGPAPLTLELTAPSLASPTRPLYDVRELFFQSIKQSLFLRAGSASGAVCMPLPEQDALWGAVADGHDVAVLDSLFKLSMYAGVAAPDAAALGNAEFLHVSLAASVLRPDGLRAAAAAAELAALRAVPVRLIVVHAGAAAATAATPEAPTAWLRIVQRRVSPGATLSDALRLMLPTSPGVRWPAALAPDAGEGGAAGAPAADADGGPSWRILVHGIDACAPAPASAPAPAAQAAPPDAAGTGVGSSTEADGAAAGQARQGQPSPRLRSRGPSLTAAEGGVTYVFHPLSSPSDSVAGSDGSPMRLSFAVLEGGRAAGPGQEPPAFPPEPPGAVRRGVSAGTIGGESFDTGRSALSADVEGAPVPAAHAASPDAAAAAAAGSVLVEEAGLRRGASPSPDAGAAVASAAAVVPPLPLHPERGDAEGVGLSAPLLLAAPAAQLWQELRYPDGWLYVVAVAPPTTAL